MVPWGVESEAQPVTAEKAMSFISKSWLDVRKSADEDLKRMRARAKSFTELAYSFDKELENLRKASLNLGSESNASAGSLTRTLQNGGGLYTAFNRSNFEELEFLVKPLSQFRRTQSNPDLGNQQKQLTGNMAGPQPKADLSLWRQAFIPRVNDEDFFLKGSEGMKTQWAARNRITVHGKDGFKSDSKGSKKSEPSNEEWEPLRKMKESWRDLESSAANCKSPSEFFDNLKKTQLFENVKKNLRLSTSAFEDGKDVPPLDVPELLAYLVRQSEPLLDQFGVKKDVAEKVCDMLQKHKRKEQLISFNSTANLDNQLATKDSPNGADELDLRISSVVQSTGYQYKGGLWGEQVVKDEGEQGIRNVAIVTTASLPWMTGTAVNPLFRAAYLAKTGKQAVTLLVPWLCKDDQSFVFPNNLCFESPDEQEAYIRNWLEARVGFKSNFKLVFYPGKFSQEKRSILLAGDISRFIPDKEADIAVLEEPEHLNWYYHGKRWTDKFQHVVGVVHTNYLEYVKREKNGAIQAFLLEHVNNWVTSIYCHKVLRLSAATQELPKSTVCNVHGVSPRFLDIGQKFSALEDPEMAGFSKGAYFLGKMVWGKGYRELIDLLGKHKVDLANLSMDIYGSGEDSKEVRAEAEKLGLSLKFHQGRDHADSSLHEYKVFINPSISDVVCTTTAEALAMGKIVVCADHPSNEFFRPFPNCFMYKTSEEFVEKVNQAMKSHPLPLSAEQRYLLSWEAATDRFIEYAELDKPFRKETGSSQGGAQKTDMVSSVSLPNLSEVVENAAAFAHFCASGNEAARLISGALPGTMNYNSQHSKDLNLPHPLVESPVYGW